MGSIFICKLDMKGLSIATCEQFISILVKPYTASATADKSPTLVYHFKNRDFFFSTFLSESDSLSTCCATRLTSKGSAKIMFYLLITLFDSSSKEM